MVSSLSALNIAKQLHSQVQGLLLSNSTPNQVRFIRWCSSRAKPAAEKSKSPGSNPNRSRFLRYKWLPCAASAGICSYSLRGKAVEEAAPLMTVSPTPEVKDGRLSVRGKTVLTTVPDNVVVTPAGGGSAFIGAVSAAGPRSYHVFTLGVLQGYRLLSLFRLKIWWMIPHLGSSGSDVPMETQMLLLEAREGSAASNEIVDFTSDGTFYILLMPLVDGDFRTSLQGNSANELQICVESGDPDVQTSQVLEAVFISSDDNPFELLKGSSKFLADHTGSFSHLENKKRPKILDYFGWCTWDAFYTEVNPQGIMEGLQSLSEGGCPARFLIIDDGWQDTFNEFCKEGEPLLDGTQFASRLVDIKENQKFQGRGIDNADHDLGEFITIIKEKYGLRYVYLWHALLGYWGGVLPTSEVMKKYNPKIVYSCQSPGNTENFRDIAMDSLEKYGIGLVDPTKIFEFLNDLHSYLSSRGVDGVKVDVQNLIETLGAGYGGRVSLTRKYQRALEESVSRNFEDGNLICCMSLNTEYFFSSKKSAVARASEDFMPREPTYQTLHVAAVTFNSLLLGEIVVPDWDMFLSDHPMAEFHGAARAVGGCGVYVSDKPGKHDFKLLKKLVLPDGSILRAKHAGRPTRDCLFSDPLMNGKSLLKIWNLNKFSGVVGVFNCQGASSWPLKDDSSASVSKGLTSDAVSKGWTSDAVSKSLTITGHVTPADVEFLKELAGESWTGNSAVYAFNSGCLSVLAIKERVLVWLSTLHCEIYTVSPIRGIYIARHQDYYQKVQFAPLGLIDMFNSGGAIEDLSGSDDPSGCSVKVKARGSGRFGAYSSTRPRHCLVDTKEEEFNYDSSNGLLTLKLPYILSSPSSIKDIVIVY